MRNRPDAFLLLLLALSLSLNVFLGWGKKQDLAIERIVLGNDLLVGRPAAPFDAFKADGNRVTIDFATGDRPTVLYVTSPTCDWCALNYASIVALAKERGTDYRFIGIAIGDGVPAQYVSGDNWPFEIYMRPSPAALRELDMTRVPKTIVIDSRGVVVRSWPGAFRNDKKREIEEFFGVRLPEFIE